MTFEDKLFIKGLVLKKIFAVDHDATVVEEDGTEVRIAPLMYSIKMCFYAKLITNFAVPANNLS